MNIASALAAMARDRPYAMAVACPAGHDRAMRVCYTQYTFRQLDQESDLLARGLEAVGIGRGVRTVLMVKPSLEFFALTFALFKAGAVPVLIDPGMGIKNLGRCLLEAEPFAFVGIPPAQIARRILGWARSTIRVSVTVRPSARGSRPPRLDPTGERFVTLSLSQVRKAGYSVEPYPIAKTTGDETAAILFTSGSTGPPKGAIYTHAIFDAQVAMLRDLYAIEEGEIDLCTFPLFALFAPTLGMSSVVPEMDSTRPARVDPTKIIDAVESFGVTNLFGSPALIRRVGEFGASRGLKLPSLRRVISAGAPVSARVLERFATMLKPGVQIFTPYGATESLPVASIGSDEILRETRQRTDRGEGVCVGQPVRGMRVEIIRITEEAIPTWSPELVLPRGQVGEIVAQGPVVTQAYYNRPEATLLAKIAPQPEPAENENPAASSDRSPPRDRPGRSVMHRMGDLGYRDALGRIWFCGRKAHRVLTREGTLFTIPCEAVFNTHPEVARTALVGVGPAGRTRPVLCVEPRAWPRARADRDRLRRELLDLGSAQTHTRPIQTVLFHRAFPVDIRHNAKIFREKLARWAARRVR
ncbi:MAG: fatty acid CoA ligase family protein [Isosphaeraceae bacterium]